MDKKIIIKIIIVAVIAAGIGFYGGMKYGQETVTGQRSQPANGFAMMGRGGRVAGQNAGFAGGQIIAKDATSITVKLQDGSSKIVFVSNSTAVMKSVQGSSSDLTVGENITVVGSTNSDGSITSQSVQIRPAASQQQQQQ